MPKHRPSDDTEGSVPFCFLKFAFAPQWMRVNLPAPGRHSAAPLPLIGYHPLLLHRVPRLRTAVDDVSVGVDPGYRRGHHRLPRPQLVAPWGFRRTAISPGIQRRGLRADVDLPRHAGRTAVMAARLDRRHHRDGALGDHSPRLGLVFRDLVAGQCGVWFTDNRYRGARKPRYRRDLAVARRAGHRRVRAYRHAR